MKPEVRMKWERLVVRAIETREARLLMVQLLSSSLPCRQRKEDCELGQPRPMWSTVS